MIAANKKLTWRNEQGGSLADVRIIPQVGKGRMVPHKKRKFATHAAADTYDALMERARQYRVKAATYDTAAAQLESYRPKDAKKYRDHAAIRRIQAMDAEHKASRAPGAPSKTIKRGRFTISLSPM